MVVARFLPRRSVRKPYRPALEAFEERTVPSTVTNLNDSGPGSLREAIALAEPGEFIDFAKGVQGTITLTTGQLSLTKDVTIYGPGQDVLTINGNGVACGAAACDRRVFDIAYGVTADLYGMTITGGLQQSPITTSEDVYRFGGGIYNAGTLYLTDSTVRGNTAFVRANNNTGRYITANAYGGGLFNAGTATVTRSTFHGNAATFSWTITGNSRMYSDGYGGAIDNAGTLLLVDSTIGGTETGQPNIGVGYGGGLHNTGLATVIGSSFLNNDAPNGGGGTIPALTRYAFGGAIANIRGNLTVINSTISGNAARNGVNSAGGLSVAAGGGIYSLGELRLINTTVADNRLTANGMAGAAGLARGAGIFIDPAFPHGGRLSSSIVTTNVIYEDGGVSTQQGPDVFGPFASRGNNLISRTDGSTGWVGSDLTGTTASPLGARLAVLGAWGGWTQTYRPYCDSPIRDMGDNTYASEWDQRGDGFYRIVNDIVDIGAYEVQHEEDCEPSDGPRPGGDGAGRYLLDDAARVLAPTRVDGLFTNRMLPGESLHVGKIVAASPSEKNAARQPAALLEPGVSFGHTDPLPTSPLYWEWATLPEMAN